MLFTKSVKAIALVVIALLSLFGCQSNNDQIINTKLDDVQPERVLTPIEIIHQSPNQYLLNKPVVEPQTYEHFNQAHEAIKDKEWDVASSKLLAITLTAPTLSGPWLLLGDIAVSNKQTAQAIAHYQQAIYVNSNNYYARNRLAALLREKGDFEGAKEQYLQALSAWPAYVNSHRNLGILLDLYIGDTEEALKHYQIAFELDALNNDPENRQLKGWIADLSRRVNAIKKAQERIKEAERLKELENAKKNSLTQVQMTPRDTKEVVNHEN